MKYLGPFIVGGALTIGALVAVQWSLVEAPDAPPVEDKAAVDPALLVADLTVPTRSIPGRGGASDAETDAIRLIGVPVSPVETEVAPEEYSETTGREAIGAEPGPIDPVETADTVPVDELDPVQEVDVVDAPLPRARPESPIEAEPDVEVASAETVLDPEAAAAARVAGGFDAVADAPQDETAAAVVALAEAAFGNASAVEPESETVSTSADPIGDLAVANDRPAAEPSSEPEVALALAVEPEPAPPPEAVADVTSLEPALTRTEPVGDNALASPPLPDPAAAPEIAVADPEPPAVELVAESAPAEPPSPEPPAIAETASAEPEQVAETSPATREPDLVQVAPAEPVQRKPDPVVEIASTDQAPELDPALEPERTAASAEQPVVDAAAGPASVEPSASEIELAALAPTEAIDPAALQFPQVSVLDAGSFRGIRQAKAVVVRLADVRPLPFAERCGPDGVGPNSWHCGGVARAELSRFIGRRPVVCRDERDLSTNGRVREVIARCTVGGDDLSLWVAANGWGLPADGAPPPIADAGREAAERAVGRHAPSAAEAAWAGAN